MHFRKMQSRATFLFLFIFNASNLPIVGRLDSPWHAPWLQWTWAMLASDKCVTVKGWTGLLAQNVYATLGGNGLAAGEEEGHTAVAECSGAGDCDRSTGRCVCTPPFGGDACDIIPCKNDCSGHGKCYSLREAGVYSDGFRSTTSVSYDRWDADKIFGCICDIGWTGHDCGSRECAYGNDPLISGRVNEVQSFDCTDADSSGTFKFKFRRQYTPRISANADASAIKAALESLETINTIDVNFDGGNTAACDADGSFS